MLAILLKGNFVSVLQKGEGKDVLFLHGYMSKKESFYYQTEYLCKIGYRVTAPDFLGFGSSSTLSYPMSVGDYAEWLKELMYKLNIKSPHIVAHSFGARVAFKMLAGDNSLCDKLIITGGAGLVKARTPRYMRKVKLYRAVKRFAPKYAERHFGSKEYRTLSPVLKQSYKKIVNEDLRVCASQINNTTLLIYGRDDTVTPANEEGRIFAASIKNSRLVIMQGGHFCFCQHPKEFNALLTSFLNN